MAARQSEATLATRVVLAFLARHHRCDMPHRSRCHYTRQGRSHVRLHPALQQTFKMQIVHRALRWSQAQIITEFLVLDQGALEFCEALFNHPQPMLSRT